MMSEAGGVELRERVARLEGDVEEVEKKVDAQGAMLVSLETGGIDDDRKRYKPD